MKYYLNQNILRLAHGNGICQNPWFLDGRPPITRPQISSRAWSKDFYRNLWNVRLNHLENSLQSMFRGGDTGPQTIFLIDMWAVAIKSLQKKARIGKGGKTYPGLICLYGNWACRKKDSTCQQEIEPISPFLKLQASMSAPVSSHSPSDALWQFSSLWNLNDDLCGPHYDCPDACSCFPCKLS